jgi:hypothetical protein
MTRTLEQIDVNSRFTTKYTGRTGLLLSKGIGSALVRWDARELTQFETWDGSEVSFSKPIKQNVSLETEVL